MGFVLTVPNSGYAIFHIASQTVFLEKGSLKPANKKDLLRE